MVGRGVAGQVGGSGQLLKGSITEKQGVDHLQSVRIPERGVGASPIFNLHGS